MKKGFLYIFIVLLTVINTAKGREAATPKILQEYPFFMTYKEFKEKCKQENIDYSFRPSYYSIHRPAYIREVFNVPSYIIFDFKNKILNEIIIEIPVETENKREPIQKYNEIKSLMIKKYGIPKVSKAVYNRSADQDKYRKKLDGEDLALWQGDLTYVCTWKLKDFTTDLRLGRIDGAIRIQIAYLPLEAAKPKNKIKLNETAINEI